MSFINKCCCGKKERHPDFRLFQLMWNEFLKFHHQFFIDSIVFMITVYDPSFLFSDFQLKVQYPRSTKPTLLSRPQQWLRILKMIILLNSVINFQIPNNGPKTYWTTLNRIINKKKTMNIPPLLRMDYSSQIFQTKADIFNELFVQQCSLTKTIVPFLVFFPDATQFWKTLRSIQVKFWK